MWWSGEALYCHLPWPWRARVLASLPCCAPAVPRAFPPPKSTAAVYKMSSFLCRSQPHAAPVCPLPPPAGTTLSPTAGCPARRCRANALRWAARR